jgi:hypothetical protein
MREEQQRVLAAGEGIAQALRALTRAGEEAVAKAAAERQALGTRLEAQAAALDRLARDHGAITDGMKAIEARLLKLEASPPREPEVPPAGRVGQSPSPEVRDRLTDLERRIEGMAATQKTLQHDVMGDVSKQIEERVAQIEASRVEGERQLTAQLAAVRQTLLDEIDRRLQTAGVLGPTELARLRDELRKDLDARFAQVASPVRPEDTELVAKLRHDLDARLATMEQGLKQRDDALRGDLERRLAQAETGRDERMRQQLAELGKAMMAGPGGQDVLARLRQDLEARLATMEQGLKQRDDALRVELVKASASVGAELEQRLARAASEQAARLRSQLAELGKGMAAGAGGEDLLAKVRQELDARLVAIEERQKQRDDALRAELARATAARPGDDELAARLTAIEQGQKQRDDALRGEIARATAALATAFEERLSQAGNEQAALLRQQLADLGKQIAARPTGEAEVLAVRDQVKGLGARLDEDLERRKLADRDADLKLEAMGRALSGLERTVQGMASDLQAQDRTEAGGFWTSPWSWGLGLAALAFLVFYLVKRDRTEATAAEDDVFVIPEPPAAGAGSRFEDLARPAADEAEAAGPELAPVRPRIQPRAGDAEPAPRLQSLRVPAAQAVAGGGPAVRSLLECDPRVLVEPEPRVEQRPDGSLSIRFYVRGHVDGREADELAASCRLLATGKVASA